MSTPYAIGVVQKCSDDAFSVELQVSVSRFATQAGAEQAMSRLTTVINGMIPMIITAVAASSEPSVCWPKQTGQGTDFDDSLETCQEWLYEGAVNGESALMLDVRTGEPVADWNKTKRDM